MDRRQEISDEELARGARSGHTADARAFEILIGRYSRHVLANCRYLTRSKDDAEDLAQEVFVKAYFGLSRFEGRAQFRTWLQRIKINHCLNYLKAREGRQFIDIDDPVLESSPTLRTPPAVEREQASEAQRVRIAQALDALPNTLRVPLLLRDVDGLSYEEVAATLDLGLSAAKMRIKRAREQFRTHYERGTSRTTNGQQDERVR